MRRGVRAITGAFGEEITAEDLRRHCADRLGRFRRRMALWLLGALLYGFAVDRAEVWALLGALLTAEAARAAFARRILRGPIASVDLSRLRAASLALAAVTGALWCLVIASLWSEEPGGARFLAMILAIAALFEAAFQYSPNRLPSLVELVLYWFTVIALFLRQGAQDGWSSGLGIEAVAMAVFAYLSLIYIFDIGAMRHTLLQAGAALAERGAALERALAELTEKEHALGRLALAVEHVNDSIVITDPEGRIEWVNGAFTTRTGWTLDEVAGSLRRSLSDPDNDPAVFAAIDAALAERRPVQVQMRLWNRGGRSVWHEASLTPLFDAEGRLTNYISVERDISERKAREAELARSQAEAARLALVAEHARDSVVIYSPQGRIEWVNPGFTAQTGHGPEEALGRMVGGMVAPGLDEATLIQVRAAMAAERAIRAELRIRRKDGSVFWCEADLSPVHGPDRRLRHYVSVERDISELKAREAELAEKERELRRLALVAQHATDCIILANPEGRVEWVNDSFRAGMGWALAEVEGRHLKSFIAPECDPAILADLREATKSGLTYRAQVPVSRRDGSAWHDAITTPIRDESGAIVHWIAVLRDISELKAREAELAEKDAQNRRLALVARHSGDAILLTDPKGVIEWVNAAFSNATGLGTAEVAGRHISAFDAPNCDPKALELLRAATRAQRPFRAELCLLRRGRSVWHDVSQTPILGEDGALVHWISVERDISDLKARECELAQARRAAEEAAEARARFLATMSHEIRTPMNGIIGTAELLAETPLGEDQRRLLSTISLSSEALLRIINDILDLSRLEAGAVEIAPEPFEPAALATLCAQLMRPLAARKGLALALELEEAAREPLMGDPGRLRQVLLNLLGNAIKFTDAGRVTLRAHVAPEGARRRLTLAVSDTGIGIAPERLEGVFDAFAQADGTITRRFGGTGLGLSISRHLAHAMGGELMAASAPGEGSTFTLALDLPPAADTGPATMAVIEGGAPGPHDPPTPTEPPGVGGTLALVPPALEPEGAALVLLVEDNATNRFLVQRMLADVGLRIAMAEDGAQGVEAFERLAPDLVITDVSMPVMDGFEATRRIRTIEAGPGWHRPPCPVLALSANVGAGDHERGAQAGVTRFLVKPIRKAELRAAVLAALSQGGGDGAAPAPPPSAPPGAGGPAAAAGLG